MTSTNEYIDLQAEQSVLGGLMLLCQNGFSPKADEVVSNLAAKDFSQVRHRDIYQAICNQIGKNEPADIVSVTNVMPQDNFGYLAQLAKDTPSAANIVRYAEIVRQKSITRATMSILQEGIAVLSERGDFEEQIANVRSLLGKLDHEDFTPQKGPISAKELLGDWFDILDERLTNPGSVGYTTGVKAIDDIIKPRGINPTDLIILGARPKMGKTQMAAAITEHMLKENELPVLFCSMEMSNIQVLERNLSQSTGLSTGRFYGGTLEDKEYNKLAQAINLYKSRDLYIDDRPIQTINTIKAAARQLKNKLGKLGLVVVDYLQLIQVDKNMRADLAYGEVSRGLKALAKELETPVLCLSQLSRKVEERGNKRPVMSDLRESGQLEQDADLILFLYRDSVYDRDSPDGDITEINIAANRHGPSGMGRTHFENGIFTEVPQWLEDRCEHQEQMQNKSRFCGGIA